MIPAQSDLFFHISNPAISNNLLKIVPLKCSPRLCRCSRITCRTSSKMPCICSSTTSQNHTESTYAYTGMMQEFDLDDASTPARKIKGLIKRLNSYKHEPDAPSKLKADSALACKAREMPETINFRAFDTIISRLDSHSEQACYSCNTLYRWTATLLRLYCGFCWDGNFPSATLRTCRFISLTLDMLFRSFIHFVFQT